MLYIAKDLSTYYHIIWLNWGENYIANDKYYQREFNLLITANGQVSYYSQVYLLQKQKLS